MASERSAQNFGCYELGDQRLNRRAQKVGEALSQQFGQGLSTVFQAARELKRAYEFSRMPKVALKGSSRRTVR